MQECRADESESQLLSSKLVGTRGQGYIPGLRLAVAETSELYAAGQLDTSGVQEIICGTLLILLARFDRHSRNLRLLRLHPFTRLSRAFLIRYRTLGMQSAAKKCFLIVQRKLEWIQAG